MSKNLQLKNAISVDVEDYFQVSAFEKYITRDSWENIPTRVEKNIDKILAIFDEENVKATFFILGWIAERHPGMTKRISDNGHEIASHGYSHTRIINLDKNEFMEEIRKTNAILENLTGEKVIGYRAPSYSIVKENKWAHEVLEDNGFAYSSSIYPIKHDLYGIPDSPRFRYTVGTGTFLEIPISTFRMLGKNIPCGGGGYFRFFPYSFSKFMIDRINNNEKESCIFYFHPWELDLDQPKTSGLNFKTRFRHYLNLEKMETRLRQLLKDFSWGRVDEVFIREIAVD